MAQYPESNRTKASPQDSRPTQMKFAPWETVFGDMFRFSYWIDVPAHDETLELALGEAA